MMDLPTAQAFFWFLSGIGIFGVAAFLCWVLYETARLIRQSNQIVEHARDVVSGIEQDFMDLRERFGSVLGNIAGVAKGASKISGLLEEMDWAPKKKIKSRK